MSKIYLAISGSGEWSEDYEETILKAFKDIKKAEAYIAEQEEIEEGLRGAARKCYSCGGLNKTCPLYAEPYDLSDECENYEPFHNNTYYRIEEVELN